MATDAKDASQVTGPGVVGAEPAHGQPLRFNVEQDHRMHEAGVLPRKGVELLDGRIEVMDSTTAYDRGEKLTVYAREAVAEVWLVDLRHDRVEAYRRPAGGAYAERFDHVRGQSLAPGAFPDVVLGVDAILG